MPCLAAGTDFENAKELIDEVSGDGGDPTLDEYEENIAGGNNNKGTSGIQIGDPPTQTTLPTSSPYAPDQSNTTAPPGLNGTPVDPLPAGPIDYEMQLSPNFKLKQYTTTALFPNQLTNFDGTYTVEKRLTSLKALSMNVSEPLLAKFGGFRVNSGLRNANSVSGGVSQHVKGEAMDVQFIGWTYSMYWDNALWVKNNIPYDQFIFEHSDKTGLAWYHLSFNNTGNRAASISTKVMTMYRNHYDPGLHRYG